MLLLLQPLQVLNHRMNFEQKTKKIYFFLFLLLFFFIFMILLVDFFINFPQKY